MSRPSPEPKTGGANGIGTLQETSLHAALKDWYAQPGDRIEVPLEGFVVDILRGDLLIEIQTGNFSAIKRKLHHLLQGHALRLVHPIAREKWIVRLGADGNPSDRRKSPRRGRLEHLFTELVRIPYLLSHPNFSLEVLFTREEEIRVNDGKGSWRRKGWSIADHKLIDVVGRIPLETPDDFRNLLPSGLPQPFTTQDLAKAGAMPRYLAQKMAYCLRKMEVVEAVGKKGRALLYRVPERAPGAGRK